MATGIPFLKAVDRVYLRVYYNISICCDLLPGFFMRRSEAAMPDGLGRRVISLTYCIPHFITRQQTLRPFVESLNQSGCKYEPSCDPRMALSSVTHPNCFLSFHQYIRSGVDHDTPFSWQVRIVNVGMHTFSQAGVAGRGVIRGRREAAS